MQNDRYFLQMLERTRENLEDARFSFVDFYDSYHRCKKRLFDFDRRFNQFYKDQIILYEKGHVVWGSIIQANTLLFEPGVHNCPAAFLYSLDPRIDASPDVLAAWASSLFSVKGLDTDPELQQFSDKLADEMVADWKIEVPPKVTEGIRCYYTTNMVFRKHLPHGFISGLFIPMLVCPTESDVAAILPEHYWCSQLIEECW